VLRGKAAPTEVYSAIASDRKNGIQRTFGSGSHEMQHINEQINLLELANLVIVSDGSVELNPREMRAIQIFVDGESNKLKFDVYSYNLDEPDVRKSFYEDWAYYFSKLSNMAGFFDTTAEALGAPSEIQPAEESEEKIISDRLEIGDEGERFVYEYEKRRVTAFNFRLAGKVIHLGKTRGLGYDIQSVVAETGENAEFVKYIEVKATKRVTAPEIDDSNWIDTLNLTRNEWIASQQHKDSYSVFRVYFVRDAVVMFILTDISQKCVDGTITAVPTMYRLDFKNNAVDEAIYTTGGAITDV
jgi:hypothetical protein